MSGAPSSSYDELPYESQFVAQSHPDRLAAMAVLFGLNPPPVEGCRVLELGCAEGGNLMAMAQSLPGGTFVGVDLSARQISDGRAIAAELGYKNVDLRAMSLTDVDDSFGRFDYIVCHGVYSWVPAEVQAKILAVCVDNLAPDGVAYVSYNIYPGWHQRGLVREMMTYHTRGVADPKSRVQQAREFLDFLARSTVPQGTPYALALLQELDLLKKCSDTYLFHEHLEDENNPVYFHEFVARAAEAGLRYVGPAQFNILEVGFAPEVRQSLARYGTDRIRREQHIDFVLNRAFRQSLLCHADLEPREQPAPEALGSLLLTATARPEAATLDIRSEAPERFRTRLGENVTVNLPTIKAAVVALFERWPHSAGLDDLWAEVLDRLGRGGPGATSEADFREFAEHLLMGNRMNLVELNVHDPKVAREPGARPRAGALSRRQAARGEKVVSLRNQVPQLQELDRLVVALLDGTRDRSSIVEELAKGVDAGSLHLKLDGQGVRDPAETRALLAAPVGESLRRIADAALLLAD